MSILGVTLCADISFPEHITEVFLLCIIHELRFHGLSSDSVYSATKYTTFSRLCLEWLLAYHRTTESIPKLSRIGSRPKDRPSGGCREGQIRPWPPIEIGNGVWPPFGTEIAMEVLWFCWKVRSLAPPYWCRLRIWPPYGKIPYIKQNKKRSSEILGDRWNLWGEMEKSFGETPKKGRWKILAQIWPPCFWSPGSASG